MKESLLNVPKRLQSERLLLRPLWENEGPLLYQLIRRNRSRLKVYFPNTVPANSSAPQSEVFIRQKLSEWMLQNEYCFGIWTPDEEQLIGFIRLFRIEWNIPRAELGYFLDKKYAGQGLMTEAVQTISQFAFQHLDILKLQIYTSLKNVASQKVALKAGFEAEALLQSHFRQGDGKIIDVKVFCCLGK
jgi:RimJ/RimL family protein N-acetyltransferase